MDERVHNRSFVDVHAHVVAGIDDGPADDGETDALLDMLAEQGVTTVVTTPHVDARFHAAAGRARRARARAARAPAGHARACSRAPRCIPGGSTRCIERRGRALHARAARAPCSSRLRPTCRERCSSTACGGSSMPACARCSRTPSARARSQADDGLARDLVARGARLQINAHSLCPGAGARGRFAWHLARAQGSPASSPPMRTRSACARRASPRRPMRLRSVWTRTPSTRSCTPTPTALCDGHDAPPFQPTTRARRRAWLRRAGRQ